MQLSKQDQQNHPALAQYVRYALPKLSAVGAVVREMHTHGLLTAQEFTKALTWGELPLIKIVDSSVISCKAGSTGWYGCNRNAFEIEIALFVVDTFEKYPTGKGTDKNKAGGSVYSLGATILHELCHWGHQLKGVSQYGKPEVGHAFENALYGKGIW